MGRSHRVQILTGMRIEHLQVREMRTDEQSIVENRIWTLCPSRLRDLRPKQAAGVDTGSFAFALSICMVEQKSNIHSSNAKVQDRQVLNVPASFFIL